MSMNAVLQRVSDELTAELNKALKKDETIMELLMRRPELGVKVSFFNTILVYKKQDEEERLNRI